MLGFHDFLEELHKIYTKTLIEVAKHYWKIAKSSSDNSMYTHAKRHINYFTIKKFNELTIGSYLYPMRIVIKYFLEKNKGYPY